MEELCKGKSEKIEFSPKNVEVASNIWGETENSHK
jgi:hypothetical protein